MSRSPRARAQAGDGDVQPRGDVGLGQRLALDAAYFRRGAIRRQQLHGADTVGPDFLQEIEGYGRYGVMELAIRLRAAGLSGFVPEKE